MSSITSDVLVSPQDLYIASSTSGMELGSRAVTRDGRSFRYALAGATALVPGKLQQSSVETTSDQNLAIAAAAAGAKQIVTTSTVTVVANYYAGGYAMITTSNGAGYQYQIASHLAASSAVLTLNLVDPIVVALTTNSKVDLVASIYSGVIVNPATATGAPVGVAVSATTAAYYGWIQVGGVTNILADGTVVVGTSVVASNGTAGAVEASTGVQALVGTAVTGIATTEYGAIDLLLM